MATMDEAAADFGDDFGFDSDSEATGASPLLDNVPLRESDIKTALWCPMLTSDSQGNVQLEFDAPQFNTTWLLQALGLDKDLYTDHITREVITQKPVMVRANAPRFLRHGDQATLMARVQNATDAATRATAIIELFDPRAASTPPAPPPSTSTRLAPRWWPSTGPCRPTSPLWGCASRLPTTPAATASR